jgi:hypothetical protein
MTSTIVQLPPLRLRLTEIEFCGWLGQAGPGDRIEYYRGFLAPDSMPAAQRLPERDCRELLKLARRALWAAEQNLLHLVQRRHGPDDYSYIAVARVRPKMAPVSLSALLTEEVA